MLPVQGDSGNTSSLLIDDYLGMKVANIQHSESLSFGQLLLPIQGEFSIFDQSYGAIALLYDRLRVKQKWHLEWA